MQDPTWTFVTVTFNSADTISTHWTGLRPADVEWIVVDNASSDGSAERAAALGADLVIPLPANVGFGGANNEGFRRARGKYIAFTNPDVTVDWANLAVMETYLETNPGLVAPQLQFPDGQYQPSGRGAPSLANKVLGRLSGGHSASEYYLYASRGEIREVSWVIGAAVVATQQTFARLGEDGPWDPAFFVYYEDSDICLRAWLADLPVRLLGDAVWTHAWARETAGFRVKPWLLEVRAMTTFYRRYPQLLFSSRGGRKFRGVRHRWGRLLRSCE